MDKKREEKIAVFDLGGGTFDISILESARASSRSRHQRRHPPGRGRLRHARDHLSGGRVKKDQGIDLRNDKMALQRLKEAAEKAKVELSTSMETDINLPFITADAAARST